MKTDEHRSVVLVRWVTLGGVQHKGVKPIRNLLVFHNLVYKHESPGWPPPPLTPPTLLLR